MCDKKNILISIIVPVYNIQDYIETCVQSICNQTYKNLEIILVDDGSTDQSGLICDRYARLDDRIMVIHQENRGLVGARKAGTEIAHGDYILNVDGDDWIDSTRIENLVSKLQVYSPDMLYMAGMYQEYGSNDSVLTCEYKEEKFFEGEDVALSVYRQMIDVEKFFKIKIRWTLWTWAIKSELLKRNQRVVNDTVTMGEDMVCVSFCLMEAHSVYIMQENGYHYRKNRETSITNKPVSYLQIQSVVINELQVQSRGDSQLLEKYFRYMIFGLILLANPLILYHKLGYLFPYMEIKSGSNVIVYGAGRYGRRMVQSLVEWNQYNVIGWVDKKSKLLDMEGELKVCAVECIDRMKFDYVIIAIWDYDIAMSAKNDLIKRGIADKNILTMNVNYVLNTDLSFIEEIN